MTKIIKESRVPLHLELQSTIDLVYDPNKYLYSQPVKETESAEYGAYTFEVNNLSVVFRVAKTTPTKIGQFVTLWKRMGKGPILPYDSSDLFDLFVISVRKGAHSGQFVFPKSVLCAQNIVSQSGRGGKRAIRVYPPWEKTENKQAQKTQTWQLQYFLNIPTDGSVDRIYCERLYRIKDHK